MNLSNMEGTNKRSIGLILNMHKLFSNANVNNCCFPTKKYLVFIDWVASIVYGLNS